jgi:hypothetical protein
MNANAQGLLSWMRKGTEVPNSSNRPIPLRDPKSRMPLLINEARPLTHRENTALGIFRAVTERPSTPAAFQLEIVQVLPRLCYISPRDCFKDRRPARYG